MGAAEVLGDGVVLHSAIFDELTRIFARKRRESDGQIVIYDNLHDWSEHGLSLLIGTSSGRSGARKASKCEKNLLLEACLAADISVLELFQDKPVGRAVAHFTSNGKSDAVIGAGRELYWGVCLEHSVAIIPLMLNNANPLTEVDFTRNANRCVVMIIAVR